jgi:addiction module HigA family antidote
MGLWPMLAHHARAGGRVTVKALNPWMTRVTRNAAMRSKSTTSTITKELWHRWRAPSHPGEILRRLYLEPLHLSTVDFAKAIAVFRNSVSKLLNARALITPDMAIRLSIAFDTTPQLWLNLQQNFDLWHAHRKAKGLKKIRSLAA